MTALAEALLPTQKQAIGALSKAYVAGQTTELALLESLDAIGCTDKVEQEQLIASLNVLRALGAPAPKPVQAEPPKAENEPETEAQRKFMSRLADDRQTTAPDYPLTKAQASQVIEQLKAGTYNPDEWTVPF